MEKLQICPNVHRLCPPSSPVLTFAQKTRQAPDEVAAAVAEGGLRQRHLPEAVSGEGALKPGTERRRLLAAPLRAQRARYPATVRHAPLLGPLS